MPKGKKEKRNVEVKDVLDLIDSDKNQKIKKDKNENEYKIDSDVLKYSLEGKMLLIKVGTKDSPASTDDITEVDEKINKLLTDAGINCVAFVTHHAVEVEVI